MAGSLSPAPNVAYARQRARFLRHLVDDGQVDEATAETLIDRWEDETARVHRKRGSTAYWKDAWLWIAHQAGDGNDATKRDMNAAADGQVYGG